MIGHLAYEFTMKLYRITDWEKHYEVSDSKKVSGPLQWVPIRTKTDGFGYLRITQEKNRTDLLAAWYLMLGIAAKQPREERGKLSRNGVPLTPEDMELLTRFPASIFAKALEFYTDPKQGWMYSDEIGCHPDASGQGAAPSDSSGSTGQYNTVQDRTLQDTAGAGVTADTIYEAYPRKQAKQEALKAIDKALKRCPRPEFNMAEHLLVRTQEYAAAVALWSEADRQFVPHPATWYNRGSYDDDPKTWERKQSDFGRKAGFA